MARSDFNLPEPIKKRLKLLSAQLDRPMTQIVIQALDELFEKYDEKGEVIKKDK